MCHLAPSFDTVGWFAKAAGPFAAVGDVLLPPPTPGLPANPPPTFYIVDDALDRYRAPDARTAGSARAAVAHAAAELAALGGGEVKHVNLGDTLLAK